MRTPTRAFAPATVANLAVGFDVLGLALAPLDGSAWGDVVVVRDAAGTGGAAGFAVAGPHGADLPADPKTNVVPAVAERFLAVARDRGVATVAVDLVLEKHLPVSSGLGGSSSSAVATLVALNRHFGDPFAREELLPLAGWAEGFTSGAEHFDNVTPALLGGARLLLGDAAAGSVLLPWPEDWVLALATPEFAIATRDARAVLPRSVPLGTTVGYARNLGLFVTALHRQDAALAACCLDDGLIEPARGALLPGFAEAKSEALARGAIGCSLSGSGPSVFAVAVGTSAAERIARGLVESFSAKGLRASARVARVDSMGARVLEEGSR